MGSCWKNLTIQLGLKKLSTTEMNIGLGPIFLNLGKRVEYLFVATSINIFVANASIDGSHYVAGNQCMWVIWVMSVTICLDFMRPWWLGDWYIVQRIVRKWKFLICFKNGCSDIWAIYHNIKTLCSNIFSRKETLRFVSSSMANFNQSQDFTCRSKL